MDNIEVRDVPLEVVWKIRQTIMYPEETIDFVKLEDDEKGMHWGLYESDNIISVISLFQKDGELQFRKFATIEDMQGKGYGTKLLQKVMDWAIQNEIQCVWCNARTSATGLYEKFGMRRSGPGWMRYGIDFVKMEKQLK
jgi:phosphoribosylformimino-5-aminoimidazole carboxamide ribotide isomerase